MIEIFTEIDSVRLNFSDNGKWMVNLAIAVIMFGVALELKADDFKKILKTPRPVMVGIISQFLVMPLITFLFALSLRDFITPTIGLGMILVAACPGGNISNFICSLSKGNVALSVSLTAFSSLGGLLLTPFNFAFWGNLYMQFVTSETSALVRSLEVDPISVLQTILLILGLPLVLGILFSTRFPVLTQRVSFWIKRFSITIFIGMIAVIFGANFELFTRYIQYIFLIVLVHNALALMAGYNLAKVFRLEKRDRKTIAIETGIQNSGLALALLFNPNVFPSNMAIGGMTFIAAWWGVWHIVSGLAISSVWSGAMSTRAIKGIIPAWVR